MPKIRICTINSRLATEFQTLGHEVCALNPGPGIVSLPRLLEKKNFHPDLVLQQETLGPRVLLDGLSEISCPRIFWSIDTHLNSYWQRHYGRLFDAVLTTQDHWVERLESLGLERVDFLPWFGSGQAFSPWTKRKHDIGFVGRITPQRKVRKWMVDFLRKHFSCQVFQDVPRAEISQRYNEIRFVPNESILNEINFRMFEAASSGCLVLNPKVGADLSRVFEPGKEIVTYGHALELESLLRYYLARPDEARRIAHAAWERVKKEHLPGHRAERVLNFADKISASETNPDKAKAALWVAIFHLWEANLLKIHPEKIINSLAPLSSDPETAAILVRCAAVSGDAKNATHTLLSLLDQKTHPASLDLNLAGSMAGLELDQWDMAKRFWYRHVEAQGPKNWERPKDPAHLYMLWAGELSRKGQISRPGFPYDEGLHLPHSALECLARAKILAPTDLEVDRRMNALLKSMEGSEYFRLGVLSNLSLHNRDDWRMGLELGLLNLHSFRIEAGMEELFHARCKAEERHQEKQFERALAARDPEKIIFRALLADRDYTFSRR